MRSWAFRNLLQELRSLIGLASLVFHGFAMGIFSIHIIVHFQGGDPLVKPLAKSSFSLTSAAASPSPASAAVASSSGSPSDPAAAQC